jgi:DNA repair photolyase
MSNSSDPYPPLEEELNLTRNCLKILANRGLRVLVTTKSDLVSRDIDLLTRMSSAVSITITTLSDTLASKLEPGAPSTQRRLEAIEELNDNGVPVFARVDPIIPGFNDIEIKDLIDAVLQAGAKHITSSTYKARADSLMRLESQFPKETELLRRIFESGERIGGSLYLPRGVRKELMLQMRDIILSKGATFSSCREGWPTESCVACDGSHLLS